MNFVAKSLVAAFVACSSGLIAGNVAGHIRAEETGQSFQGGQFDPFHPEAVAVFAAIGATATVGVAGGALAFKKK